MVLKRVEERLSCFFSIQLTVYASTTSVQGFSHLLQKRGQGFYIIYIDDENPFTLWGPQKMTKAAKYVGFNIISNCPRPSGLKDSKPLHSTLRGLVVV